MIMLMMGFLFGLICLGPTGWLVTLFVPSLRSWSMHVLLVPLLAGLGGLVASWGLGVGGENLFGSSKIGGIGFFSGFLIGIFLGAIGGYSAANRISVKSKTK